MVLILLFRLFSIPTSAQSIQPLIGVTPAIIEEAVVPNTTKETIIYAYNLSDQPLPVKVSVKPFNTQGEEIEDQSILNINSWIKIFPQTFILKPHERKIIKVTIKAPLKTEPGTHLGTLLFTPMVVENKKINTQVNNSAQVGVLSFITVKGNIVEDAEIQSFTTKKVWFNFPIKCGLKLKNSGNIHFFPTVELVIKNIKDKVVAKVPIKTNLVLPKTSKIFSAQINSKRLFGYYKAEVQINYGPNHKLIKSDPIKIWIIPLIILLPLIFLTSIVIYLTIKYKKLKQALKILFHRN